MYYDIFMIYDVCVLIYEKGNMVNNITGPVHDSKTTKKLFYKIKF